MFKANSKSTAGKAIFYTFEISALVIAVLLFVLAIYNAAKSENFMVFLSGFVNMIVNTLIVFGLGKICDLLYSKKEAKAEKAEAKNTTEDIQ